MKNNFLWMGRFILLVFFFIINCAIATAAKEQYNYAITWKSMSNSMRDIYLMGFQDGSNHSYLKAAESWLEPGEIAKKPEPQRVKKVRENVALFFKLATIRDVVSNLYNDPANSFIPFSEIIYLSIDKLRGDNIDDRLRKARKEAHESYQLLEQMNN